MKSFGGGWDDDFPAGDRKTPRQNYGNKQRNKNPVLASRKPRADQAGRSYVTFPRIHAARDGLTCKWAFVKARGPVSDVDTRKFPYQLVREEQLPLYQQQQSTVADMDSFLNCFTDGYIRAATQALSGITIDGSLTVMACFGQTLFRLHSLDANRSYQLEELRGVRYPNDVQSSWSNICDDGARAVRLLIDTLKRTSPEELKQEFKITVYCSLKTSDDRQDVKTTFVRQHDRWVLQESRALSQEYVYHDIILDNSTRFRVKVFSELTAPGKEWWSSIHNLIRFQESGVGNSFATKVTLDPRASKDLRINYVSIESVYEPVEFHGLRFQLSTQGNDVSLDVLPPEEMLEKKQPDESFEFLVKRLVQVLDEF
ncbi:hypothetical protein PF005_g29697 [Phytophthora fragariae]|uniref:Uncharacterized protein n=1 Tax=Phytophthora fragariae TaxID=53985 RepID=A0A6A3DE78_9STRA|nr:hypothetical protein PF003_g12297 [Phytophthora fragariae]KAE8919679.1 hypothetical protein PF009_g30018 [Phytophthora fragariae]KAE8963789.1 hypothetical protein PF011_g28909 [Phytophthora fragariae]KAE9062861.1 hypothetical protein PF010_g29228 [Phytophthora fragariae]KAE9063718.1 hypothetical protein PF007_g29455 [Phytophthora fragariae]